MSDQEGVPDNFGWQRDPHGKPCPNCARLERERESIRRELVEANDRNARAVEDWKALQAELTQARADLEEWKRASQEGHGDPCTLGPLCPYCEIDSLRAQRDEARADLREAKKALVAIENRSLPIKGDPVSAKLLNHLRDVARRGLARLEGCGTCGGSGWTQKMLDKRTKESVPTPCPDCADKGGE